MSKLTVSVIFGVFDYCKIFQW